MCIFPCTFPESGFVLLGFVSVGTISRQCIVSLWRLGHWCQVVPQWCVGAYLSLLRQPVLLSSLCLWLPSPSFHRLHLSFHPLCVLEHWVAIYFTQIVKFLCSDLFLVSVVSLAEPARTVSCSVFYVFTLLLLLSLLLLLTPRRGSSSRDHEYHNVIIQNFTANHLIDVEVFQSGPEWKD